MNEIHSSDIYVPQMRGASGMSGFGDMLDERLLRERIGLGGIGIRFRPQTQRPAGQQILVDFGQGRFRHCRLQLLDHPRAQSIAGQLQAAFLRLLQQVLAAFMASGFAASDHPRTQHGAQLACARDSTIAPAWQARRPDQAATTHRQKVGRLEMIGCGPCCRCPVGQGQGSKFDLAFIGSRQIGQDSADVSSSQAAHHINAKPPHAVAFAARLVDAFEEPVAVLFYGSVLRTGDLDGVMDFYVLTGRPRAGWREAYGWSLQETADRINEFRGDIGLDPGGFAGMTAPTDADVEAGTGDALFPQGSDQGLLVHHRSARRPHAAQLRRRPGPHRLLVQPTFVM